MNHIYVAGKAAKKLQQSATFIGYFPHNCASKPGQEVNIIMPGSYGIVKLIWRNEVVRAKAFVLW